MPLYDYRCQRGHVIESLQPMRVDEIHCACGQTALRVAANRVAVTAPEVDSRGLFRRFNEATAEMDHRATKVEQSTGEAVSTPNLWKAATQKAAALASRGESPSFH